MPIPFSCTDNDYLEVYAAHAVWANIEGKVNKGSMRLVSMANLVPVIVLASTVAWGHLAIPSSHAWIVDPHTMLLASLMFPAILLAIILATAARMWWRHPTAAEALHRQLTSPKLRSGFGRTLHNPIFWIGMFFGFWEVFLLVRGGGSSSSAPLVTSGGSYRTLSDGAVLAMVGLPSIILFYALGMLSRRDQIQTTLRSDEHRSDEQTLEFSDDGVQSESALGRQLLKWPAVIKFLETENLIVLYSTHFHLHIIPKRAFEVVGELDAFIALLIRHVPEGVLLPRRGVGFPVQPLPEGTPPVSG